MREDSNPGQDTERTKKSSGMMRKVILIGLATAIAAGYHLYMKAVNCCDPVPRDEAVGYLPAIKRAQQSYRIENPTFAHSVADLEFGPPEETRLYRYDIVAASDTMMIATATAPSRAEYPNLAIGLYSPSPSSNQYVSLLCIATELPRLLPIPQWKEDHFVCPPGSKEIIR